MTRAMRAFSPASGPRWLRWALVRDGRIVREARIGPEATLETGTEGDVPWAEIEGRAPLAFFRDGRWWLSLHRSWEGRIGERTLESLAPKGEAPFQLPLESDARARLVIGGEVVLLQVIERPPRKSRAELPAPLRGGLFERADWWFTAFVTGSFILHFAFVAFVLEADWPIERALIPARDAELIFMPIEPPPEDAEPIVERTDAEEPDGEVVAEAPAEGGPSGPPSERRSRDPQPSLSDREAREVGRAVAAQIGALMGGQGSAVDRLIGGAELPSHDELMEVARGGVAMNGEPGELREREGAAHACTGDECAGDLGRLARSQRGGRPVDEGRPVEEVRVVVVPAPGGPQIDEPPPGFDTRQLIQALRRRMTAVRRCFEHEITSGDPDAGGRLSIAMRVMPPGHLADVRAEENETGSTALAECVVRSIRAVRLPVGPSEPIEVRYPIVFQRRE